MHDDIEDLVVVVAAAAVAMMEVVVVVVMVVVVVRFPFSSRVCPRSFPSGFSRVGSGEKSPFLVYPFFPACILPSRDASSLPPPSPVIPPRLATCARVHPYVFTLESCVTPDDTGRLRVYTRRIRSMSASSHGEERAALHNPLGP